MQMIIENISLLMFLLVILCGIKSVFELFIHCTSTAIPEYPFKLMYNKVESKTAPIIMTKVILNTVSNPIDTYLVRFDTNNGI